MKFIIVCLIVNVLVALVYAAPQFRPQIQLQQPHEQPQQQQQPQSEILRHDSDIGTDSFKYAYATSDGIEANAEGQLKRIDDEHEAIVVRGAYKFLGDDGETYSVSYIADENGFQPQGAHIPSH